MTLIKLIDYYNQQIKYAREIALALVVVAVVCIAGLTYRWYSNRRIEQAHHDLAKAIELFDKSSSQDPIQLWQEIDAACADGYLKYASTPLGPYFLAFQAESALRQNRQDEARELLKKALGSMSPKMPLYYDYVVKLACMDLDSNNPELAEQAKQTLQKMVDDRKHPAQGMAAYYLGLFFFESGDHVSAQNVWSTLEQGTAVAHRVWAHMAQAKVDYIA